MNIYVTVYQRRVGGALEWTTLGWGPDTTSVVGHQPLKLQRNLSSELRKKVQGFSAARVEDVQSLRGVRLERARLELVLRGSGKRRQVSGLYPVIVDPRWTTERDRMMIAYHPLRQEEWCPVPEDEPIEADLARFLEKAWAELDDADLGRLATESKDQLRTFSFEATPKSVLERLPKRKKGIWDDLVVETSRDAKKPESGALKVLNRLATQQTHRALEGALPGGWPRSPYREHLLRLLGPEAKRSTIVVGPSGSGKSTLIAQWVRDLADANDYPAHHNLDRLHDVWMLSGRRLIAGMMYLGDWEQRCIDLVADARRRPTVLWIEDLHAFGRIGRTRTSERSFADFFRGPVSRGELTILGECTPEQLQRLEDDAPSFAALFARVTVQPTTPQETLRMILHAGRRGEQRHALRFGPDGYRALLELGDALYPAVSQPGRTIQILNEFARTRGQRGQLQLGIGAGAVVTFLSAKSGVPPALLDRTLALSADEVREVFTRQVAGQPVAVDAVVDLVMRIRSGLVDAGRAFAVYLFTGPTGTGKTELASCLASYLYGSAARLIRLDMGEFGGPDAVPRLIGDRWAPEGVLTRAVQAQPFSVVLLDEIEKAHPAVLNLLLQVFDEGRLTDAGGAVADFRRTVLVMTSNLGARTRSTIGFGEDAAGAALDVARAVREHFPPELFNRIDRVIPFGPLSPATARAIAAKELGRLVARRGLTERRLFVEVADALVDVVVAEAFDPRDGARPVKRWVERVIGGALTEHIVRDRGAAFRRYLVFRGPAGIDVRGQRAVEAAPRAGHSWVGTEAPRRGPDELLRRLESTVGWLQEEELAAQLVRVGHDPRDCAGPAAEVLSELRARYQALHERLSAQLDRVRPGSRWSEDDVPSARGSMKVGALRVPVAEELAVTSDDGLATETIELIRQTRRAGELEEHQATVALTRLGRAPWLGRPGAPGARLPSLVVGLAQAIAAALRVERRDEYEQGSDPARLALALSQLGVARYLSDLRGVYILESSTHGTTMARLDVHPGLHDEATLTQARAEGAQAYLDALARGESDAEDPEPLDRVVAHLRVRELDARGAVVELEDHLGCELLTGRLDEVLTRFFRLHASWEEPA